MDVNLSDESDVAVAAGETGLSASSTSPLTDLLSRVVGNTATPPDPVTTLDLLITRGFHALPPPGGGQTRERFECLAEVAAVSLPLAKLYEAHTDAMAIFAELAPTLSVPQGSWGVFAAEPQPPSLFADPDKDGRMLLTGIKDWCSGALDLSHALVTARSRRGQSFLLAVSLRDPRVTVSKGPWAAVGMARTETARIAFNAMPADVIGHESSYLSRAGFWHGAIGVAACWYGGASLLASKLRSALILRHDDHGLAHLGAAVAAMDAARLSLTASADAIDLSPTTKQQALALSCRATVEQACEQVLAHAGRALGAKPFCMDAQFAAMAADLPVFLRQSHAERDLQQLGAMWLKKDPQWTRFSNNL